MSVIRITKDFDFEMAHALYNHDGHCKHIHGHSYKLSVTVRGKLKDEFAHPHDGMVMDFSLLKKIVKANIVDVYDHALVMNGKAPYPALNDGQAFQRVISFPFQPTCENMVVFFVQLLQKELPVGLQLVQLKLNETATSFAEWRIED